MIRVFIKDAGTLVLAYLGLMGVLISVVEDYVSYPVLVLFGLYIFYSMYLWGYSRATATVIIKALKEKDVC